MQVKGTHLVELVRLVVTESLFAKQFPNFIDSECHFADAHERAHVLEVHDDGIAEFQRQVTAATGNQ